MVIITINPVGRGRYDAFGDDRYLVTSRVAFLDAARVLAAQGIDPETPIALRHAGSPTVAMRSTVGAAAADDDRGTRFVPYRPWSATAGASAADRLCPGPGGHQLVGATL